MELKMARSLKFLSKPMSCIIFNRSKSQLNQAVREAERVIGYSTSFLNLRWLLTDEIATVALHVRKLAGTNHPLLQTASKLFTGNSIQNWGLIVLLISKAAGLNNVENEIEEDRMAGVLNSQRVVAEVTETIRMSYLIHKSVINVHNSNCSSDLNFGNRLALLCGDFLLGRSYNELAHLFNNDVSFVMSSALRDLVESEFIGCKPCKPVTSECVDIEDILHRDPLDSKIIFGNPRAEWIYRSILGGGSLLAKSCQSTLKLAKHPEYIQQLGYEVGINIALAWQAQLEREDFISNTSDTFSLVSAPIMLHLEQDNSLFELMESNQVDYSTLRKQILLGHSLSATKSLQNEFCSNALKALSNLPYCDARTALENIIIKTKM